MQSSKAKLLRENWGDKPCEHPDFDREYYLGSNTGDYVCITCGEIFTNIEKNNIQEERKSKL